MGSSFSLLNEPDRPGVLMPFAAVGGHAGLDFPDEGEDGEGDEEGDEEEERNAESHKGEDASDDDHRHGDDQEGELKVEGLFGVVGDEGCLVVHAEIHDDRSDEAGEDGDEVAEHARGEIFLMRDIDLGLGNGGDLGWTLAWWGALARWNFRW